jgi:chitinase
MHHRLLATTLLAAATLAGAARAQTAPANQIHRDIYYYQTQYNNGVYVSLAPTYTTLNPSTHKPVVTDIMIAAFHLGYNSDGTPYIHLNDNIPQDPIFAPMWPQAAAAQQAGITARMMLGGAAQGSYQLLFSQPQIFYPVLASTIRQYKLNGIDLDIEETVTLQNVEMLIEQLHKDFGANFIITLSPVATDLEYGYGLGGFNYKDLYTSPAGQYIAWFNTQFYSGFGDLYSTTSYDTAIANGYPPNQVVAGMLTNAANGGGFTPIPTAKSTVAQLSAKYSNFGGVAGWEYFDSLPGGIASPITWATTFARAMYIPPATP